MTGASDRLIASLVDDLEPVRPRPRLRLAFAVILVLWATMLGVVLFTKDAEIGFPSLFTNRIYFGSFVGLAIAAFGGTISALAAGVPGRERLEVRGMLAALAGLVAAALVCLLGVYELGLSAAPSPEGIDAMCFRQSALLSVLPVGLIMSFLIWGWAGHPVRAALLALLASGALGAMIIHTSCGFLGPRHMLLSHLSVPIVFVSLGIYPLAVVLRRARR